MLRKITSPEDLARLADLYINGRSISALARDFSCCRRVIDDRIRTLRVQRTEPVIYGPRIYVAPETTSRMIALYNKGWSIRDIAKEFSYTSFYVHYHLRKHNVQFRPEGVFKGKLSPDNIQEIIREYKYGGLGAYELGKKYGVSFVYVYKLLKNNHVKILWRKKKRKLEVGNEFQLSI